LSTTEAATAPRHRTDNRHTGRHSSLIDDARRSADRWHRGQHRAAGAPYIEHPVEVARLLRAAGASDTVVAAGLLHDVLEKSEATVSELQRQFGQRIADLVQAVSDRERDAPFAQRKRDLRAHVEDAGGDAAVIFAADSVSKVRELRRLATRQPERFGPASDDGDVLAKLEHYECSARMLRRIARDHPLVGMLRSELAAYARAGVR
jgi:(p)ppGpp synthase/HD superfamily hydrolase